MKLKGPNNGAEHTTFQWFARPYEFMTECRGQFGNVFQLQFRDFGSHIFISDPHLVEQVFRGNHETLHAGAGNRLLEPFLGSGSLLLLDGPSHSSQRQLLRPFFQQGQMNQWADRILEITHTELDSLKDGASISLPSLLSRISQKIIIDFVLGSRYAHSESLINALEALMAQINRGVSFASASTRENHHLTERMAKTRATLLQQIATTLDENLDSDCPSILTSLAQPHSLKGTISTSLPIFDQILTLILAGHETSATTLCWALKALSHAPQVRQKVQDELEDSDLDEGQKLLKRPYLKAVIQETLRLYPPIPIVSRQVQKPMELDKYSVSPGTHLTPCIYLSHRNPDVFEKPDELRPDRFFHRQYTSYEYFPFGGGKRRCIGREFALIELPIVLGTILKRVDLEFEDQRPPKATRRNVTVAPIACRVFVKSVTGRRSWTK